MLSRRGELVIVLLFAIVLFLPGIFSHSLWSPDEPTGAAVSKNMLTSGDWIVTRLNGEPFVEKPPLYWWTQIAGYALLGVSDASARTPSVVFTILALLATFLLGERAAGRGAGLWAALILATTGEFNEGLSRIEVDAALVFFVALIYLGFAILETSPTRGETRGATALIAAAAPLAFLSKGLVGIALGLTPPVLYLVARDRLQAVKRLLPVAGLVLLAFAMLVLPWALALYRRGGPEVFQEWLVNNALGRLLHTAKSAEYGHGQPPWYYLTAGLAALLPWSLALPAALKAGLLRREAGGEPRRLLFWSLLIGVALLSLAASKRTLYLLPLLPGFAVGIAWWMMNRDPGRSWDRAASHALLALGALVPVALWAFALRIRIQPPVRLALTPLQVGLTPERLAIAGVLALGLAAAVLFAAARHLRRRTLPPALALIAPFAVLFLTWQTAVKALADPIKNLHDTTRAISEQFPDPQPIVGYETGSTEKIAGMMNFDYGRNIRWLASAEDVRAHFAERLGAALLVSLESWRRLPEDLRRQLDLVYSEEGRKAAPYAIARRRPGS